MKNRIQKMKAWMSENSDLVFAGVVYGGLFAAGCAALVVGAKQQAKIREELAEAASQGHTILPNTDGTYWIIKKTA